MAGEVTTAALAGDVAPQHWFRYPGNQLDAIGEVKGPNVQGLLLTVVCAIYDHDAGVTRVGYVEGARCSACGARCEPGAGATMHMPHKLASRIRCAAHPFEVNA
jgi:hypothetical protein